jgi:hypothetical protein
MTVNSISLKKALYSSLSKSTALKETKKEESMQKSEDKVTIGETAESTMKNTFSALKKSAKGVSQPAARLAEVRSDIKNSKEEYKQFKALSQL